jgi:hypothetical protein
VTVRIVDKRPTVSVTDKRPTVRPGSNIGPRGPSGQSGASYTHTQASASATWTVAHNLGVKPSVQIYDTDDALVLADVAHLNVNTLTISFATPVAGTARCN